MHTYEDEGNYTVSLVSAGPGGMDSVAKEDYISVLVGMEEFGVEGFVVYPNPASGAMRLRYLIRDSGYLKADLYSIEGVKIRELKRELVTPGTFEMNVDVSDLEDGVYFLRLQLGSEVVNAKLVVK